MKPNVFAIHQQRLQNLLTGRWAVVCLLILYWVLALSAAKEKSTTIDEIAHLTAGYSYWRTADFRLHPENGNLPQRWAALPLLFQDLRFPDLNQANWQKSNVWDIGYQFFYQLHNPVESMLWQGRAMIAVLGVALGWVVYRWSKSLFGPVGGIISLLLFTFCPTTLAHGALVTSDMAAALGFTSALFCFWVMLHRLTVGTILLSSLATAFLFLSKMSAILILPMYVLLAGIRLSNLRSAPETQRLPLVGRMGQSRLFLWAILCHLVVGIFLIWICYGLRYSAFKGSSNPASNFFDGWTYVTEGNGPLVRAIDLCRNHHLLPEAYLYGFAYVLKASETRDTFLNGSYGLKGHKSFFPYCLLVKTPLPLFLLLALAGVSVGSKWYLAGPSRGFLPWPTIRNYLYQLAPLLVLLAVYWIFAIWSHLNIGHRHILPTYPAMFILAGGISVGIVRRSRLIAILVSAATLAFVWESFHIRPHYLAYFNQAAGGPRHGYRHLVDSSLDWGQDLPGLKHWLDHHRTGGHEGEAVYLSYFGGGSPEHYGIEAVNLPGYPYAWSGQQFRILGGGIYCISATMLHLLYTPIIGNWNELYEEAYQTAGADSAAFEQTKNDPKARQRLVAEKGQEFWDKTFELYELLRFGRLCAHLRQREPDDEVGYSILIYRLTQTEVHQALFGPPAEMVSNPIAGKK